MDWNAALYDKAHGFVAEYGKNLLAFVPKDNAQCIIDIGCGTGALTARLKPLCGYVLGVDASESMVAKARAQHPEIPFEVCDATALPFESAFDVAFSNAVFHWIPDHDSLLASIRYALKPNGRLVCEFGAHGNVAAIGRAFDQACARRGLSGRPAFHLPTAEEFTQSLLQNGFAPETVEEYDRPTPLGGGEAGLSDWLRQFFASTLSALPKALQDELIADTERLARGALWNGREWVADYRRLRAVAKRV